MEAVRGTRRNGPVIGLAVGAAAIVAVVLLAAAELSRLVGAVSSVIAARLPRGGRHLAVELDRGMAAFLRQHQPGIEVINGDARDLPALLISRDIPRAAAVILGLPWSLFDSDGVALYPRPAEISAQNTLWAALGSLHDHAGR
jgi:phosphatidylethanolamine/phosphatidyl-N-methylethanolamine N-methyltransferase